MAYSSIKYRSIINPLNTVWTLVAAFLVFGMQAGFTMLEAGFCRSRETVNVLVECVFDTCLCGFLFYAWGYAFMFGQGNGLIGWHDPNDAAGVSNNWFFLKNITATTVWGTSGVPVLAHWVFQFAFADCASTICSGTMIGRTGFIGDIVYSVFVSGFIYPIIGHWAWGPDGFLAHHGLGGMRYCCRAINQSLYQLHADVWDELSTTLPVRQSCTRSEAGSRWPAASCLGPRLGRKFKRDGGGPMLPHDLVMGVIGGFILWFGWYGFNPGSSLSAMDFGGIGRIAANTTLAASTGGLAAESYSCTSASVNGTRRVITNGFLAGLVAITCPCYWVSPTGACALGAIAGVIVVLGVSICLNSCESMIRSVRGQCTDCAVSGEHCRWAYSPPVNTAQVAAIATGIPSMAADGVTQINGWTFPLQGAFYGGGWKACSKPSASAAASSAERRSPLQ